MQNNFDENKLFFSLIALVFLLFAGYLIFQLDRPISGLAQLPLSLYFALIAWRKDIRSNSLFFICVSIFASAIGFEVGISLAYFLVIGFAFAITTCVYYFLGGWKL